MEVDAADDDDERLVGPSSIRLEGSTCGVAIGIAGAQSPGVPILGAPIDCPIDVGAICSKWRRGRRRRPAREAAGGGGWVAYRHLLSGGCNILHSLSANSFD